MSLKISRWLEILAFKLRQKSLYFELKHYIKNNETYFRKVRHWERGIGKTYSLIKLADKFKCPIVVPTHNCGIQIKRMAKYLKIKDVVVISHDNSIKGNRYNAILCDEGISEDFINEVLKPMCKCLVGYISTEYGNKKNY